MTEKTANSDRLIYATFPPGLKAAMKPATPRSYGDPMSYDEDALRIESIRFCNETQLHKIVAAPDAA